MASVAAALALLGYTQAGARIVAESGESAAHAADKIVSKLSLGQTRQLARLLEEIASLGRL